MKLSDSIILLSIVISDQSRVFSYQGSVEDPAAEGTSAWIHTYKDFHINYRKVAKDSLPAVVRK